MNVDIRRARADDLAAIEAITQAAYLDWAQLLGYPPLPMVEDYGPRIARGEVQVAVAADVPLGLIVVERDDGHDTIFSVAVALAHAGKGIGRRLIGLAEEQARAAGQRELRLYTNALMASNIELYDKLGYQETGRRPNAARPGFYIVDMAKAL